MVFDGLPWNRSTNLSTREVYDLYMQNLEKDTVIDCAAVSPYCRTDGECLDICGTENYQCINHTCIKPFDKINPIKCNSSNGGIVVQSIDGDNYCVCSKPMFYIGPSCETINPLLRDLSITSDFNGLVHDETTSFIRCNDANFVPILIRDYITCVHKDLIEAFAKIYVVE